MLTRSLYIRCPVDLAEKVAETAADHMTTMTAFMLRATEYYLEHEFGWSRASNKVGLP